MIADDRSDRIVAEAGWIVGLVLVAYESFMGPVEQVQAAKGPYPEGAFMILVDRSYPAVTEARGIIGVVTKYCEIVAVKPVEAILGSDPEKSPAVLQNAVDRGLGEPFFNTQVLEAKIAELSNR